MRVEQLVSGNTDVDASLPDGLTALMLAAFNGHAYVMDILMNAGAEGHIDNKHGIMIFGTRGYTNC